MTISQLPADDAPNDFFGRYIFWALPVLLRAWKTLLLFLAGGLVCAVIHLHFIAPYYEAQALLGPGGSSPQSSTQNPLSTLSALTGISGPAVKLSPYDQFQQVLQSNDLALHLSNDEEVLEVLFPGARDVATHTWKPRTGVLREMKILVYDWLNWPVTSHPDTYAVSAALNKHLTVARDGKTNVVKITLRAGDPELARRVLAKVILESDDLVRVQFLDTAQKYGNFIDQKLKTLTSLDQRTALDNLLTEYDRMEILAGVGLPFTSSIIDPPFSPASPAGPNPMLIVAVWLFLALLLGGAFALRSKWIKSVAFT